MSDLATDLRAYVDAFDAPFDPNDLIERAERTVLERPGRLPTLRRGLAVAVAAAAVALVVVGGVLLSVQPLTGDDGPVATGPAVSAPVTAAPQPTTMPTTTSTAPTPRVFEFAFTVHFPGGAPYELVSAGGWLWGALWDDEAYSVVRLDPVSGEVDRTVGLPGAEGSLAGGDGAVWAADWAGLSRIDTATAEVTGTVALEWSSVAGAPPLAVGEGAVWVASGNRILRVDPDDLVVTGEITVPGAGVEGLAAGGGSIWALWNQTVHRIDPASLEEVSKIVLPGSVFTPNWGTPLHYVDGSVWVSADGLVRIDAETGLLTVVYADPNCCGPLAMDEAAGFVIATGLGEADVAIVHADGGFARIGGTGSGGFGLAGDERGFWVSASSSGQLLRYDLVTPGP